MVLTFAIRVRYQTLYHVITSERPLELVISKGNLSLTESHAEDCKTVKLLNQFVSCTGLLCFLQKVLNIGLRQKC